MLISEFIEEVLKRADMDVKELATATGLSTGQLSRIKNSNTPGTWKTIMWAIAAADLRLEDCLTLPLNPETALEDKKTEEVISEALRLGGKYREVAAAAGRTLRSMLDADRTARQERIKKKRLKKAG